MNTVAAHHSKRSMSRVSLAATALAAIGMPTLAYAPAEAAPPPPAGIISEPVWINGKVGKFDAPYPTNSGYPRRETMFVVGPQDEQHPQEAGDTPHDHVMNLIPYGSPATCHVWKVVANDGPFADRVHVRDSGLAYEVDLGDGFERLVSTRVITEALAQGIVGLEEPPEGFGDFDCWTTRQP